MSGGTAEAVYLWVDTSLVMCVGVHVDGGFLCGRCDSQQEGGGRWRVWAEAPVCGQSCVGRQTCWHMKARLWQSVARDKRIFKVCVSEP